MKGDVVSTTTAEKPAKPKRKARVRESRPPGSKKEVWAALVFILPALVGQRVLGLGTPEQAIAEGGSGVSVNFWLYLFNSVMYAGAVTLGQVFFCSMAAYAFARLRWPGRNLVFGLFLGALLVPPIFTSLPNFILIKNLGLLNTLPGMILPAFLMTPFAIFFLRQFFLGINREIEEAASIDGAGPWRI